MAVVQYALSTPYLNLKCGALSVLVLLAQSVAVDKFDLMPDGPVLQLCREGIFHHQVRLASASIRLLTHLAIHAAREDLLDLMPEVSSAIETLLMILCTQESESDDASHALRGCLRCIVLLCDADPDLCSQFVDVLGSFLSFWSGAAMLSVCEGLCALGSRRCGVLSRIEPRIRQLLSTASRGAMPAIPPKALVLLWTLVPAGRSGEGFRSRCCALFANLANKVSSEQLHFWLVSLAELCRAEESLLVRKGQMQLTDALTHYVRAISALKAATTPAHALQFQAEYVRLRCEGVRAHAQLLQACSCLRTAPPPAIAASVASATRDELQKCGRVVAQLRKCSRDFKSLADQYGVLYQTLFDADPGTLRNVQLLQQNALLVMQAIDRISQYNQGINSSEEGSSLNTLTPQQVQLVERLSQELVLVAPCLPRYFFQALQATTIKLAVSPQQKGTGEPLFLAQHAQLALRVEGVVQHRSPPGSSARTVHKVLVSLATTPPGRSQNATSDTKVPPGGDAVQLSEVVQPHNDYFQAQFLVALTGQGLHTVTIDTAVLGRPAHPVEDRSAGVADSEMP
ncbi:hypothetical protein MRX96_044850 [Rhipicephalus microplus]